MFPDRGLPVDCSGALREEAERCMTSDSHPSWALWSELKMVDWQATEPERDQRISEFALEDGRELFAAKWLYDEQWAWVRDALDHDSAAVIRVGDRIFRRVVLKRIDSFEDTEFLLLMRLMAVLAERFGDDNVRMVVWFA